MTSKNYAFKFNSNISTVAIKAQITKWTKGGEIEKIKAHEFAVSLAMRYRDHGNYDLLLEVADAIGHKFTKHARTAFIEWMVKATSLQWKATPGKDDGVFEHVKSSKREFDETYAVWNTSEAKHDSGWCDNNHSMWTMVKKEQLPFDYSKQVKNLLKRAVENHVDLAKARMEFNAAMEAAEKYQTELALKAKAEEAAKQAIVTAATENKTSPVTADTE